MSEPQAVQSIGTCPTCGTNVFAGDRFCGGCGSTATIAAEAELLADLQQVTLGEYEILGILGRGGMGLVFVANDLALNRKVAVKVLPPFLLTGEAAVERFRREARTAGSLRHRHITSVYGLKETTRIVFFVMEYVAGRTLDGLLQAEGWLPSEMAETVLHDIAGALTYAHRREVVHRDLKPSNILVDTEGMAIVSDFGVAKAGTSTGLTATGSTVGSPKYMSPEQWYGRANAASDQYAFGCVAYEILAGRAPFLGEAFEELMRQHLFEEPERLAELRPDCSGALTAAIMRMLAKDPDARFPSMEAALAAMELRPDEADGRVRRALADLARQGQEVSALPKTPKSPIPTNQAAVRRDLLTPAPTNSGASVPLRWALAIGAAPVIIGLGAYLMLGPRDAGRLDRGEVEAPATSVAAGGDAAGVPPKSSPAGTTSVASEDAGPAADPRPEPTTPRTVATPPRSTQESPAPLAGRPESRRDTATPVDAQVSRDQQREPPVLTEPAREVEVAAPSPPPTAVVQLLVMPWANVFIDDAQIGQRTRWEDTLAAGVAHRLRFERDGYVTVDTTISLQAGEQRLLRIQMRPRSP